MKHMLLIMLTLPIDALIVAVLLLYLGHCALDEFMSDGPQNEEKI